mgnify:CR=1 FL=1
MAKFGVKEVMDVTFYDTATGKPVLFCDTLKMTNLENTAEETSARGGKGNAKLLSWDFNREATMAIQDALLPPRSFELLSGNKVTKGTAKIHMRQSTVWENGVNKGQLFPLTASATGEIQLAFTPNETASNILVYLAEDDGGTPLTGATLNNTTLTVTSAANKKVVVYYTYNVDSAETYLITSDAFPSTYKIVGDTVIRNAETGKDEAFQIVINKAKVKPGFSLQFQADGDPSVFDMNIEILRESDNTKMITMIQY